MELHIKDRINILQLLPNTGSYPEYALKRSIYKKVGITPEEQEKFQITEDKDKNKLTWDGEKDAKEPIDVTFTQEELDYLRKCCEAIVDCPNTDDFWRTVEVIYNPPEK